MYIAISFMICMMVISYFHNQELYFNKYFGKRPAIYTFLILFIGLALEILWVLIRP